jgi:hypothetical protein
LRPLVNTSASVLSGVAWLGGWIKWLLRHTLALHRTLQKVSASRYGTNALSVWDRNTQY